MKGVGAVGISQLSKDSPSVRVRVPDPFIFSLYALCLSSVFMREECVVL